MALKKEVQVAERGGIRFLLDGRGRVLRQRAWLSSALAFCYDFVMRFSVFPKKLGADIDRHGEILRELLQDVHGKRILELGAGSGAAAYFLAPDNSYVGTDVSPGLLRQARRKFEEQGFQSAEFYAVPAEDLPFRDDIFDGCLCILALNFFDDVARVFEEVRRVLRPGGVFLCAAPVPERNARGNVIRGTLRSEAEIARMASACGLRFETLPAQNGCILYFRACLAPADAECRS